MESTWKRICNNDSKDGPKAENKMEVQKNTLETWIEKLQETYNKELEKNKQYTINNKQCNNWD